MSNSIRKTGRSDDYYDEKSPNKKPKQENEEPAENEEPVYGAIRESVRVKYCSKTECPYGEECCFLHFVGSGSNDDITINFNFEESALRQIGGRNGSLFEGMCAMSRSKHSIKDHESGSSSKILEFQCSDHLGLGLVREFLWQLTTGCSYEVPDLCPGLEYKTQLCDRFSQGFCPDGAKCHFAHGAGELRRSFIWGYCYTS